MSLSLSSLIILNKSSQIDSISSSKYLIKPQLFKNLPNFPKLPYNLELLISKCWDHNPKKRPTIKIIHKQLREWWIGSWNKNMNDIITPFLNLDKTINNNIKEFDPIYIHNTLDISDDEEDILLKLSKEIEFTKLFEPLSDQFTSYNKKDELYIIPGTFPNTEPYYSKENIFTQSDIIFYNAYLKELVKEMHHYWIMNNLSSILLKNWTMVMRIFFFYILSFIYFIICLFVLNRTTYVVVGYNMFDEELMKNKIGI
ncbi:1154_t:CDS:2 [Rhizophagus irregularis]|nr:1154_t:CDS:2 [Rhizophagus irregularis]